MKKVFAKIIFISLSYFAAAQNSNSGARMTLQQCIEKGIANNLQVQQTDLQSQSAEVNWKQSKTNLFPNLNASANHGINQGRSIDPFTNSYINQQVNYASYGASSGVILFNGLNLQNNIRQNALEYRATKMELQQAKDNLTINIILAYLQVLSNEDVLVQSRNVEQVTRKQVERLEILNNAGAIIPAQYYDLKGQFANDQLAIINDKNNLETSKVNLSQLMNVPYDKNLELERLPVDVFNLNYEATADKIYKTALQQFALIKAVDLRRQSSEKAIKSIKGELFPTLSLSGNVNTNYSSAAQRDIFINTTDVTTGNYIIVNGNHVPVISPQSNFNSEKITYNNQLNQNLFTSVNLGLRIPIFNSNQVRNRIKLAKINLKNNELIEQNTKTQLQQSIEQAYVNLTTAADRYKVLLDQVKSFSESFRSAEVRFNAGAATSVDYLIAKNNVDRTNINLITAKYDFVLRTKILDYYQGKALW